MPYLPTPKDAPFSSEAIPMHLLALALGGALALLLTGMGGFCLWMTVMTERPTGATAPLWAAMWYMGQGLAWTLLALLAGGVVGLAFRAVWRVIGP